MPISQRPAPIDAFHEEAEVAICASLAVFIFFVHSIAGRSAALNLDSAGCSDISEKTPPSFAHRPVNTRFIARNMLWTGAVV